LQQVNDQLRTAEAEGGDEHLAAALDGAVDRLVKSGDGLLEAAVRAVAVGAFAHEQVRRGNRLRGFQDRQIAAAEVAAEGEFLRAVRCFGHEVDHRRAEHVARFNQPEMHAGGRFAIHAVLHRHQHAENTIDIVMRVRAARRTAPCSRGRC